MDINLFSQENLEKLPLFDLPVDYVVYDKINYELLKFYQGYPCKIDACVFAYVAQGRAKARVNLLEFEVKETDLATLIPGSFIEISEVSDDIRIDILAFSSSYLKSANVWSTILPLFNKPVMHTNSEAAAIYDEMFTFLTRASEAKTPMITGNVMTSVLNGLLSGIHEQLKNGSLKTDYSQYTHENQIVNEFLQLAFENYREEHKISFYAHQINLTLSHFCSVISKATGKTPQEIIKNMLIMDAQTQLKGTSSSVTAIASSLGVPTATAFNRYFRTYTGMTPLEYRNS